MSESEDVEKPSLSSMSYANLLVSLMLFPTPIGGIVESYLISPVFQMLINMLDANLLRHYMAIDIPGSVIHIKWKGDDHYCSEKKFNVELYINWSHSVFTYRRPACTCGQQVWSSMQVCTHSPHYWGKFSAGLFDLLPAALYQKVKATLVASNIETDLTNSFLKDFEKNYESQMPITMNACQNKYIEIGI